MTKSNLTLGLDLGPNSIGWALIDEEACKITAAGVRIFPEGVDNFDTKKEKPKKLKAEAESGKGAEEVLHYAPGVKPPDPKVGIGDKCEEGTAGCKNGEFGGEFFGE